MTDTTVGPVFSIMFIPMTRDTCGRCTFIHSILMAFRTTDIDVPPYQREAGIVMIKGRVAPSARIMTGSTIRSKLAVVCILVGMAGITIRWGTLVHPVDLACAALNICMLSGKREIGIVVIEGHVAPSTWVMTCTTVRPKLPVMIVLVGMTGITIRWCTFVYTIGMTCLTLCIGMLPGKREIGIVMIKIHIRPFGGFMASTASRPELTVMMILICMAGVTIRWSALVYSIGMT